MRNQKSSNITRAVLFITAVFLSVALIYPRQAKASFSGQTGRILFTTNRDGNFEIYSMKSDGSSSTRLTNNAVNDTYLSVSPDGTKVVFVSNRDGDDDIFTMNIDGSNQVAITTNSVIDELPKWSPDGTKIVFDTNRDGNFEIYTMNIDGTSPTNISNAGTTESNASWSPDGTRMTFVSSRDGNNEIYSMKIDGTDVVRLTNNASSDSRPLYSPDGTKIAHRADRDGNGEIYVMNVNGTSPVRLTTLTGTDDYPDWSPDGTKLAWDSASSGNREIWVMNSTDGSNKVMLTNNALIDTQPSWQPLTLSPIATNDNVTAASGEEAVVDVLDNDTDTYGSPNPASITISSGPAHGIASVNTTDGVITYTATAGYSGSDSLTYQVCSSESAVLCDTAVLGISVTPGLPVTGFNPDGTRGSSVATLFAVGIITLSLTGYFLTKKILRVNAK